MCVNPATLNNGVAVGCRKCWQCKENKINDWVGRNIAEQKTAVAAHSITLTYGRDDDGNADHVRAALLTFSDVQKFFRALRDAGYPLRYFVAGEYGSAKGRAHWHAIIYWLREVPEHEIAENFHIPFWPHGHTFWDEPNVAAIRYVCKYILKDAKSGHQGHVSMSKRPPLGAQYFDRLARRYVEQGLSPQTPFYSFADARDRKGNVINFYLKGPSLDIFLASYLDYWSHLRGGNYPHSDMVEEYCDRMTPLDSDLRLEPQARRLVYPWRDPPSGNIRFSETRNAYYADHINGQRLYWSFDEKGDRSWQDVVRTETSRPPPERRSHSPAALAAAYRDQSQPASTRGA